MHMMIYEVGGWDTRIAQISYEFNTCGIFMQISVCELGISLVHHHNRIKLHLYFTEDNNDKSFKQVILRKGI